MRPALPTPLTRTFTLLSAVLLLGWTPYRTKSSLCDLRWYGQESLAVTEPRAVVVEIDQGGLSNIGAAQLSAELAQSLQAWNQVRCPAGAPSDQPLPVTLLLGSQSAPSPVGASCSATHSDGTCAAKVSNGNYVRAISSTADWPYGTGVFALTVLTYNTCSGEIVDGDILLDDASHQFCIEGCNPSTQHLRNTLTHEVGHLLGLDHSAVPQATMYYSAPAGEVQKITLHGDDIQGVCASYAGGCGRQHSCAAPPTGAAGAADSGCSAAARPKTSGAVLLGVSLIAAVALWLRRRPVGVSS